MATPPAPSWNPSAPTNQMFINPNPGADGMVFERAVHSGGEWHVYPDGHSVWVAGGGHNYQTLQDYNAQQAALHPIAPTPPPAPVAAAPPPPPSSTSSTPQPTSGSGNSGNSGSVPPAPSWNPTAPTNQMFINPNPGANGQVFEIYATRNGEWHIYPNGKSVWVAGNGQNVYQTLQSYNAQQAALHPIAPTPAPAPAPGAPAPGAPAPPNPGGVSPHPPAPNWDPNAPASDLFMNKEGKVYQVQDASANGEWHIYQDGHKVWSPGASWEQPHMTPAQYEVYKAQQAQAAAGANPNSISGVVVTSQAAQAAQPATPGQPTSGDGSTYRVEHGDTLSKIATAHGVSLSHLESLNPQIKNPDMIFPGETVNLGGGGSAAPAPSATPTSGVTGGNAPTGDGKHPNEHLGFTNNPDHKEHRHSVDHVEHSGGNAGPTGDNSHLVMSSGGGAAMDFPKSSSYSFTKTGSEAEKALDGVNAPGKAQGWEGGGMGSTPSDVAKGVFQADSHPNTDPLKINDKGHKA